MSLIDQTYFKGGYFLPNLEGVGAVTVASVESLNWYIAKYEPEYLRLVLGETLYNAFIAGLAIVPIPAKWTSLKNKLIDSTNKLSQIAGYVYFFEERDRFTSLAQQGQSKAKSQNAENVINTRPMRTAYNDSIDSGLTLRTWLNDNISTYPEFTISELSALDHLIPW